MREVCIIGVGIHPFGRFPEKSYIDLARKAILDGLHDAGVAWKEIQAVYAGSVYQGMCVGQNVLAQIGATGVPVYNVENACSSGVAAMQLACDGIRSGRFDVCLAFGVEKQKKGLLEATNMPMYLRRMGFEYSMFYASEMQRYMHESGTTIEQVAKVAAKNHRHAALCPNAHYQNWPHMTVEDVLNSRVIATPLTVMMIPPASDGAAAVILCAKEYLGRYRTARPVMIASSVLITNLYAKGMHHYISGSPAEVEVAAVKAYEEAGIGPENVDVAQVADGFAFCELENYAALHFCRTGEEGRLVDEGVTELGGRLPVNTDGGQIGRGNALGAHALAGIVESVYQLRGDAGSRQVRGAKVAANNSVGAGANTFVTILKRLS